MMLDLAAPLSEVDIGGYIVEQSVIAYIQTAARETDIDFDYLLAKASQESGFSSQAAAGTTSAVGMYQFTEDTWLNQMKAHGHKYGYGALTDYIRFDRRGRYSIVDASIRKVVMDLRHDPKVASLMAAEYAKSNKSYLEQETGREVTSSDLYLAHFLGPKGASTLINAEKDGYFGVMSAADLFPEAASANNSIFYSKDGVPYTVREVRDIIESLFLNGIKRFSELPENVLKSLPKVSFQRYDNTELTAPLEDEIVQSYEGYSLDDISLASSYDQLDDDDIERYASGYDLDVYDKGFDYAALDELISRSPIVVIMP